MKLLMNETTLEYSNFDNFLLESSRFSTQKSFFLPHVFTLKDKAKSATQDASKAKNYFFKIILKEDYNGSRYFRIQ